MNTMRLNVILYFFSNFFLICCGLLFILPLFFSSKDEYDKIKKIIFVNKHHNIFGFFGILISLLILVFPMNNMKTQKTIIIVGDLIPMIVIFIMSATLLFGQIRHSKILDENMSKKGDEILTSFQIPIGIAGIICGIIHIIIPDLIFF